MDPIKGKRKEKERKKKGKEKGYELLTKDRSENELLTKE